MQNGAKLVNIGDLNVALHSQRLCRVLSSNPHLTHVVYLPQKICFKHLKILDKFWWQDLRKKSDTICFLDKPCHCHPAYSMKPLALVQTNPGSKPENRNQVFISKWKTAHSPWQWSSQWLGKRGAPPPWCCWARAPRPQVPPPAGRTCQLRLVYHKKQTKKDNNNRKRE